MIRRRPTGSDRWKIGLVVVAAVGFLVLATSCSSGGDGSGEVESNSASPTASPTDTSWSFTDDEPLTVELDAPPQRIVAYQDVAATLLDFGIRPVAIFGGPVDQNPLFEGSDMSGIVSVGEVWGEINLEQLTALDPDLVVSMQWGAYGEDPPFGFNDYKQWNNVNAIAPVISVQALQPAPAVLERYVELAAALGADMDSEEFRAKEDRYDSATQALLAAVESRPDISVVGYDFTPVQDGLFVANPAGFPDLLGYSHDFGVDLIDPKDDDGYWQNLSAERIDTYEADVILYDSRNGAVPPVEGDNGYVLWSRLPAVVAGQIVPWFVPGSGSFSRDAQAMELLAEAIVNAQDVA